LWNNFTPQVAATPLSACKCYIFGFGKPFATSNAIMAEKQSSKDAVKKLLEGRLDPRLAREITEAVEERVLKNTAAPAPEN